MKRKHKMALTRKKNQKERMAPLHAAAVTDRDYVRAMRTVTQPTSVIETLTRHYRSLRG